MTAFSPIAEIVEDLRRGRMVVARSAAEMPVVTPRAASMDKVKLVA